MIMVENKIKTRKKIVGRYTIDKRLEEKIREHFEATREMSAFVNEALWEAIKKYERENK